MTLLGWMLYAALVGGLLAVAGWLLERGMERFRLPLRWIWAGVLALGLLIPLWSLLSLPSAEMGHGAEGAAWVGSLEVAAREVGGEASGPVGWGTGLVLAMNRALQSASDAAGGTAGLNSLLGWGWGGVSAFFLGLLVAGGIRVQRRSRRWLPARMGESEVLVAPTAGPAVVGLLRPRIVLPARCRELADRELQLILQHEEEHLRARDPLLLATALVPLVLMPWNPAFWWAFLRLRTALEVDCDRRVLARGARASSYGALLVRIGAPTSHAPLPVLSLAGSTSTLERRLNAMKRSSTRNAVPVSILCAVLAVTVMVLACQADTPLAPDMASESSPEAEATVTTEEEQVSQREVPDEPHFTPFTVAPEILNRGEVMEALQDQYPTELREAGIGGTAIVHLFIDDGGTVRNVLVANSSGHQGLDEAALRVATTFEFAPAQNRAEAVPVWIQIPLTFLTQ